MYGGRYRYNDSSRKSIHIRICYHNFPVFLRLPEGKGIVLCKDYDGEEKYFAIASMRNCDWAVGVVIPRMVVAGELHLLVLASVFICVMGDNLVHLVQPIIQIRHVTVCFRRNIFNSRRFVFYAEN